MEHIPTPLTDAVLTPIYQDSGDKYKAMSDLLYKLERNRAALLEALKRARPYIHVLHANLTGALNHDQTCVKPDLDYVDSVIASMSAPTE